MLTESQRKLHEKTGILIPASRILEAALRAWTPITADLTDERRLGAGDGAQGGADGSRDSSK